MNTLITMTRIAAELLTLDDGTTYLLAWNSECLSTATTTVNVSLVETHSDGTTTLSPVDAWHGLSDARIGARCHHRAVIAPPAPPEPFCDGCGRPTTFAEPLCDVCGDMTGRNE